MNYIYSYYIDDNSRIPELIVSYESLMSTNPSYPVYCLVGKYVTQDARTELMHIGINLLEGAPYNYSEFIYGENGEFKSMCNCTGKLNVYRFCQFDKIVYLDSDTWVQQNIEELFEEPDGSACRYCWDERQRINGGVVVIEPNDSFVHFFESYIETSRQQGCFTIPDDQELLWHYYSNVDRLNYCYNVIVSDMDRYMQNVLFDVGAVKVYHFVGTCFDKKVWQTNCTEMYHIESQQVIRNNLNYFNAVIEQYKEKYPNLKILLTPFREE